MRAWVASLAVVLVVPISARAQTPETVLLDVVVCAEPALDPAAVLEGARVELASDGIGDVRAMSPEIEVGTGAIASIRITQRCDEDGAVFLAHIDDLVTRKSVERAFVLTGVPAASVPRALALAVAELLRASWAELEIADAPVEAPAAVVDALRFRVAGLRDARGLAAPVAPVVDEPEAEAAQPRPVRLALSALAVVRAFPAGGSAPVGGRLALDIPLTTNLVLRIDGEVLFGTSMHPLGIIDLGLATGGLTLAFAAPIESLRVLIGARAGGGIAWTRGHAFDPMTGSGAGDGFALIVEGILDVELPIADVLSLRFGLAAGGAPVGFEARVAATPAAGLYGGAISGALGVSVSL